MQSYLNFETEAEYRRSEWEREIAAAARAEQACPRNGRTRWAYLPHPGLVSLLSRAVPRLLLRSSWNTAAVGRSGLKPCQEAAPL